MSRHALIQKWRDFANRTTDMVERISAGPFSQPMADTIIRMRGLRDQANACADELEAIASEPAATAWQPPNWAEAAKEISRINDLRPSVVEQVALEIILKYAAFRDD